MSKTNVLIYTNVGKSQISETDSHFKISGIPITVDDDVMNEVGYFADDNKQGMPTMTEKPITLRHPEVNGVNVSAVEGKGLNYFSGSLVESEPYLNNGKWLVDTQINKKKLAAQDDGDRWTEILSNKEMFGVSTGLTFTRNNESGELNGKKYKMRAIGQNYDHLAFLDPKVEAPAGGENTMVRFNANVEQGDIIVCNIDNDNQVTEKPKGPENQEINQSMFNKFLGWLASHGDFAPAQDKGYNSQEFDVNHQNEDLIMDRSEMLEALGLATNSQVSDDELKMLMKSKLAANASEGFTIEEVDTSKAPEWAETLINKVNSLESQITANANKELDALVGQVVELKINGIDEEVAKTMGVNALKGLLAANGAEFVAAGYGGPQGRIVNTNSDDGEYRSQKPGLEE